VYLYRARAICLNVKCTVCASIVAMFTSTVRLYHVFTGTIRGLRDNIRGLPVEKYTLAINGVELLNEYSGLRTYDTLEDLGVKTGSTIILCPPPSTPSDPVYVRGAGVELLY